jgi:hypothetical protein
MGHVTPYVQSAIGAGCERQRMADTQLSGMPTINSALCSILALKYSLNTLL